MTSLKFEKIKMPSANLGKESDYPLLFKPGAFEKGGSLDETECLFLNYGKVMHTLPYSTLSEYDHAEDIKDFDAFILENDNLKAVFIPSLGGRLWSLYDKKGKKDLVINNPVFRPCNLALRDAWFSGGVEWNCSVRGHHPLTCDKIYGGMYTFEDGTPALRMYAFERIRAVTYQMDFFLPEGSTSLYARMRLVNASDDVTPIYWWSTIAVEQKEGARVIVPADETYVNHGVDPVYKSQIPVINGVDTSYPTNHTEATDHFFKIPEEARKFEAYIDAEGSGIIHSSTKRLKGRKMFVWGTSKGGENWQKFLTNKEGEKQPYLEIQAGLAYTQNESLPFPPHSAWEWLEAYSPIDMDPSEVHGEYGVSRRNVESWLDNYLPESELDGLLEKTKPEALKQIEFCFKGHPWATLDNELRAATGECAISPHLDFGELEEEQLVWHDFLKNGYLDEPDPKDAPKSFMVQKEWFDMLKKSVKGADKYNWYAWYNLGICWYARDEYDLAKEMFEKSLSLAPSTWAYHGLACAEFSLGNTSDGAKAMAKALSLNPSDLNLAKEAFRLCQQFGEYDLVISLYDKLCDVNKANPLIKAVYAECLGYVGRFDEAMAIFDDPDLVINDIREGDDSIALSYIYTAKEIAKRNGRVLEDDDVDVPDSLDFRMFHVTK